MQRFLPEVHDLLGREQEPHQRLQGAVKGLLGLQVDAHNSNVKHNSNIKYDHRESL